MELLAFPVNHHLSESQKSFSRNLYSRPTIVLLFLNSINRYLYFLDAYPRNSIMNASRWFFLNKWDSNIGKIDIDCVNLLIFHIEQIFKFRFNTFLFERNILVIDLPDFRIDISQEPCALRLSKYKGSRLLVNQSNFLKQLQVGLLDATEPKLVACLVLILSFNN